MADVQAMAALSIQELSEKGIWVFPNSFDERKGLENQYDHVFSVEGNKLRTNNIVGFIGRGDTQVSIVSRFCRPDGNDEDDFFVHYMLAKVLSINLFGMKHTTGNSAVFNFYIYLFHAMLRRALRQGLFKEYRTEHHNDSNVKGPIDVPRHLRLNTPFAGRVAYSTRTYRYDNRVTQLIRHTIEYLKESAIGRLVLSANSDIVADVRLIVDATPSYSRQSRERVIAENLKPVSHPFFLKYRPLQQLCLKILRHEKLNYGHKKDEIYGIIIDAAWLWEEYLAIVLKGILRHHTSRREFYLFENAQHIVPDFLSDKFVADAKYIPLDRSDSYDDEKATAIYYKTIAYMVRFGKHDGHLIYPAVTDNEDILTVVDHPQWRIIKRSLPIPQNKEKMDDFITEMENNEKQFRMKWQCDEGLIP